YLPGSVSPRRTYWWTFSGAFLGGSWAMLLGAANAASASSASFSDALVSSGDHLAPGFGPVLLSLLALGQVSTGALNFYGGSLTLLSIVDTIKPLPPGLGKRIGAGLAGGGVHLGAG